MIGSLISGGLSALGSLFSGNSAEKAAKTQAEAMRANAAAAAEAAKFKPVGVSTGLGSTNYGYDANGRMTSAGYTLDPRLRSMQGSMFDAAPGMLGQFTNSMQTTAPMGSAAQTMLNLGQGYLGASPQEMSQKYMTQQMQLAAPGQQAALDELRARQQATGTSGLSVGGGVEGMMATNPEQAAYWNARLQQERQMAAQADQGGQQYAQFGAGMMTAGGQQLRDMYGTQSAAFDPYKTAMGGITGIEGIGQNILDKGMDYGNTVTSAAANAGQRLASGQNQAAQLQYQADANSPWGNLFSGAGKALSGMSGGDLSQLTSMFGSTPSFGSTAGVQPTQSSAGAPMLRPQSYTPSLYTMPGQTTSYGSNPFNIKFGS